MYILFYILIFLLNQNLINFLLGDVKIALLIGVSLASLFVKLFFSIKIARISFYSKNIKNLYISLIIFFVLSILRDFLYLILSFQYILYENNETPFVAFWGRLVLATFFIQNYSFVCFFKFFTKKEFKLKLFDKLFILFNLLISSYFVYLAFAYYGIRSDLSVTFKIESLFVKLLYLSQIFLYISTVYKLVVSYINNEFPKILSKQLYFLIVYIFSPYLLLDHLINRHSILYFISKYFLLSQINLTSLFILLNVYLIYYCFSNIMRYRFLNIKSRVEGLNNYKFVNGFHHYLEQFSYLTNLNELENLTQNFFHHYFDIDVKDINFFIKHSMQNSLSNVDNNIKIIVERHIADNQDNFDFLNFLYQLKFFSRDDLEFTNFYEQSTILDNVIKFLDDINCDIFLPIYNKKSIIAYIIISRDSNKNGDFFNNVDYEHMLLFAKYLSNVINIIINGNINSLIKNEKELKDELHNKIKEIDHYKESIRFFLKDYNNKKIGIIFYKNNRFNIANNEAHDIIQVDINNDKNHPLTKAFNKIVDNFKYYKIASNITAYDVDGNKLLLSSIINSFDNSLIIIVSYCEISDILKNNISKLKDPSRRDYLLYLETTKFGKLINDLLPSNSEFFLNFKINLLNVSLSNKPIFLNVNDLDIIPIVELINTISLRPNFYILDLKSNEVNMNIAKKIFGINDIFNNQSGIVSILEKLDRNGTLLIKNIEYLELTTQDLLAEFLNFGFYNKLKSEIKKFADVRVILSSSYDIDILFHKGLLSKKLFDIIGNNNIIILPSLSSLSSSELFEYIDSISGDAFYKKIFENYIELDNKDKEDLIYSNPSSFSQLKSMVYKSLAKKSNELLVDLDLAIEGYDIDIINASKLGKKALKDKNLMANLWMKIKNQNKIANILGVNRSSVNRRLKDYNLIDNSKSCNSNLSIAK